MDDASYFHRRAEDERLRAESASEARVRSVHEALRKAYLRRAEAAYPASPAAR